MRLTSTESSPSSGAATNDLQKRESFWISDSSRCPSEMVLMQFHRVKMLENRELLENLGKAFSDSRSGSEFGAGSEFLEELGGRHHSDILAGAGGKMPLVPGNKKVGFC